MDFMSILGRCLLLPFPVAMFVGCLFPGIDVSWPPETPDSRCILK